MCGFFCLFSENYLSEDDQKRIIDSGKLQFNRGPDSQKAYFDSNFGCFFNRLKIIDLTKKSDQPLISKDKRYILSYNGEIFNYKELQNELRNRGVVFKTDGDAEVLMEGLISQDINFLQKVQGMFAFVFYDRKYKRVIVARDRFGIKPLYYFQKNTEYLFSSEIKSILKFKMGKSKLDQVSAYKYLSKGWLDDSEDTFFQDIKKIRPGTVLEVKNKKGQLHQYYKLTLGQKINYNPDQFYEILKRTMRLHSLSEVKTGATLSSGVDSTTINYFLSKNKNNNFESFSLNVFNGYNENIIAEKTARQFSSKHHSFSISNKW